MLLDYQAPEDPSIVYVEVGAAGDLFLEKPGDVAHYRKSRAEAFSVDKTTLCPMTAKSERCHRRWRTSRFVPSKSEWPAQDRGLKVDSPQFAFRLERGSTGFRHSRDAPLPKTDPRSCRTAWYAAARAARGRVGTFAEQQYPQNFHNATINDRDGVHNALFHAQYPLIAFVDDRRYWYTDEFQDPPAWAASLNDFGFTVLSASLLKSPLAEADTAALSAVEWKEIKHWQPKSLGATLFNSWD